MPEKEIILTHEGIAELESNLEYLKTVKRLEIAEQIKTARAFGDISENAEYDEAKNEQARIENEISNIEKMLSLAKVIDAKEINTNVVSVGSVVKVLDMEFNEEMEFSIVGSAEANPSQQRVSNESPFGMAVIGKKKGNVVQVQSPAGMIKYKILGIGKIQ